MDVYTIETGGEKQDGRRYVSARCPHIGRDGYVCDRQLLKVECKGDATIEIKCPKCKSLVRVRVIG